jgi:hypothetical protein
MQWTKKGRSSNVKDRQYNGQKWGEAVVWRTDNTMDKKWYRSRNVKNRQYNGLLPFLFIVLSVFHITASTLFCPLYCLSFTLRLLSLFVHCIVCPSHYGFCISCPLYCLSFTLRLLPFLTIVWSHNVKDRQNNGQTRIEAVMWRTDNTMDKKG